MSSNPADPPRRRISWVYATLPINIALGPIGTFVSLHLLQLDGIQMGTVAVAAAATAFNAVSIPAAVIWGVVTDRLHRRKVIIVSSYLLSTILIFSFLFTDTTANVILVYSLISLISSATATPLNLLIMETEPKNAWANGFARLSLVSSIGAAMGYVLSSLWVQFFPPQLLVIPLTLLSLVSVIAAVILLQEPSFVFEREVVERARPIAHRFLAGVPLTFLKVPSLYDFRNIFRGLRNELTSYVPMLYISLILFYLGSGIYNTALVPALSSHGLSGSDVYAVIVVASVAQILAFRFAGKYISAGRSLARVATESSTLRGTCYALLGVAYIFFRGASLLIPSIVLYTLAAGVGYGIYYTASNTMVFNSIKGNNHGSSLGVYSAMVAISTTIGSAASGVVSPYLGFPVAFVLAGGLLLAAAMITRSLARQTGRDGGQMANQ